MMMIAELRQDLIDQGKNPDDYNIEIDGGTIKVYPKTDKQKLDDVRAEMELMKLAIDEIIRRGDLISQ